MAPRNYVFSADGTLLAGVGGNDLLLWRLDSPEAPVVRHPLTDIRPDGISIDTTARVLRYTAVGSDGVTLVHGLDIAGALTPHWSTRAAAAAALSADGSVLAVLDSGGKGPPGCGSTTGGPVGKGTRSPPPGCPRTSTTSAPAARR
ncbi:hypothetical protein ACFQ3Z_04045 [Streptomyces nogalater]